VHLRAASAALLLVLGILLGVAQCRSARDYTDDGKQWEHSSVVRHIPPIILRNSISQLLPSASTHPQSERCRIHPMHEGVDFFFGRANLPQNHSSSSGRSHYAEGEYIFDTGGHTTSFLSQSDAGYDAPCVPAIVGTECERLIKTIERSLLA
jgi:hypothetical protein